jgi:hypothetical protein
MSLVATVPAQLVNDPPLTYSWTPSSPLNFNALLEGRVAHVCEHDQPSSIQSFSTPASGSQPPTTPANPSPTSGAAGGHQPDADVDVGRRQQLHDQVRHDQSAAVDRHDHLRRDVSPGTLATTRTASQIITNNGAGSTTGPV